MESSEKQVGQARALQSPSSKAVHAAILREGCEELARPARALAWSGFAAGLSMGFSLVAEGLLESFLPDAPWRPLIAKLGYSLGFLIVILGRQQLFTENTLTAVLPLLHETNTSALLKVARLWAVVLVCNLLGAAAIGWTVASTAAFEPQVQDAFIRIGHQALEPTFGTMVLRGVFAGWLIAMIVWLMPFAGSARIWIIILFAYTIGLGKMPHVIAGSVEVFALAAEGEVAWGRALMSYTLPAFIGNVIGGVTLVAALNHSQAVAGDNDH